ncbi:hypothetical protein K474DRAFT_1671893 [Panus rudis PR-1116 ss-1]|nr:hypothetical protein K474DRAFT_1671893 [Panus rudis PR-1116 ss-1]
MAPHRPTDIVTGALLIVKEVTFAQPNRGGPVNSKTIGGGKLLESIVQCAELLPAQRRTLSLRSIVDSRRLRVGRFVLWRSVAITAQQWVRELLANVVEAPCATGHENPLLPGVGSTFDPKPGRLPRAPVILTNRGPDPSLSAFGALFHRLSVLPTGSSLFLLCEPSCEVARWKVPNCEVIKVEKERNGSCGSESLETPTIRISRIEATSSLEKSTSLRISKDGHGCLILTVGLGEFNSYTGAGGSTFPERNGAAGDAQFQAIPRLDFIINLSRSLGSRAPLEIAKKGYNSDPVIHYSTPGLFASCERSTAKAEPRRRDYFALTASLFGILNITGNPGYTMMNRRSRYTGFRYGQLGETGMDTH